MHKKFNKLNITDDNEWYNCTVNDVKTAIAELKTDWNAAVQNGTEYVVLQSHPGHGWGVVEGYRKSDLSGELETFGGAGNTLYDFLLWLKAQGAIFMTPSEYTEYASANID